MDELEQSRLLEEYRANVVLWTHDDNLRQQRTANFLTVTTILLAGLALVISAELSLAIVGAVTVVAASFGLIVCTTWRNVHLRNAEYVRFRRFQLRDIEARLPGMTTFANKRDVFASDAHSASFAATGERFDLDRAAARSSTGLEQRLPVAMTIFWSGMLLAGVALLVAALIR